MKISAKSPSIACPLILLFLLIQASTAFAKAPPCAYKAQMKFSTQKDFFQARVIPTKMHYCTAISFTVDGWRVDPEFAINHEPYIAKCGTPLPANYSDIDLKGDQNRLSILNDHFFETPEQFAWFAEAPLKKRVEEIQLDKQAHPELLPELLSQFRPGGCFQVEDYLPLGRSHKPSHHDCTKDSPIWSQQTVMVLVEHPSLELSPLVASRAFDVCESAQDFSEQDKISMTLKADAGLSEWSWWVELAGKKYIPQGSGPLSARELLRNQFPDYKVGDQLLLNYRARFLECSDAPVNSGIPIHIKSSLKAQLTQPSLIRTGQEVTLTPDLNKNAAELSHRWLLNGVEHSNQPQFRHVFTEAEEGDYRLTYEAVGENQRCHSTNEVTLTVRKPDLPLTIFPNPIALADGFLKFQFRDLNRGTFQVGIFDMNGRWLAHETMNFNGSGSYQISLPKFSVSYGIYHLVVVSEDKIHRAGFVTR